MPVEIRVPRLGESVVEATVAQWLKREGDTIKSGDLVAELESDKANVDVLAESDGVLQSILRQVGETVGVNEPLAILAEVGASIPVSPAETLPVVPVASPAEVAADNGRGKPTATPVAQKLAAEAGIDLAAVKGSGPGGKVYKEDVEAARATGSTPPPAPPVAISAPVAPKPVETAPLPALFTTAAGRREEREPMSRLRRTIAERLVAAQHNAAMLTTFNEADMSAVMEIRKRRRDSFKERHGVGLGFMSFFTKAAVGALKAFPYLNAEIQGEEILKKFYYDIGVAVSTERGLVVPVVRDADNKTFAQIEKDIIELAGRAREGKLSLADMTGGTFTLTNGGIFGSLMSTPILNAPQVGILGMHKIQERPVVVNGEIVIRPMMYLALSYDHRIVDGREAVSFLVKVKELIEDPETLLLEG